MISAYTLAFGGFLLLGGRLGDLLGRRRVFPSGLVLFTVASLAGGFAIAVGLIGGAPCRVSVARSCRRPRCRC